MPRDLSSATWPRRRGLRALTEALGADHIRWVGGAVRDTLLGLDVNDVDCATLHEPPRVIELCEGAGIRTVPTGIDHGTVTAVFGDGPVEITTLRRDVATDGRHATIAFATDWRDDAARRDFTINALYAHPLTLAIADYFGGLDDLAARRVRFIGNPRDRIAEDHLRILRYYRFQTRFGSTLDAAAEDACAQGAATLKGLSRERVASELLALLALPDPHATLARMDARGVLPVILPETGGQELAALARLIAAEREHGSAPDPVRRLAALIPARPDLAERVAARLRLSNNQRERLVSAAGRPGADARVLAYRLGVPQALDALLLAGRDPAPIARWTPPSFPLKGGTVIERGVAPGPAISRILKAIEARWVEEGFPGPERVETLLAEELKALQSGR